MMWLRSRDQPPPSMTLEGVLGQNSRLDDARGFRVSSPGALCVAADGQLLFSSGNQISSLLNWGGSPKLWAQFDRPVTALCSSPGGRIAVGLSGGTLAVLDREGTTVDGWSVPAGVASITDCLFRSEDEIVVVDSGYGAAELVLSIAPWDQTARGQVVSLGRMGEVRQLAGGLHCPTGLCADDQGNLIVALLERSCLAAISGTIMRSGFPAYLGRIRKTDSGYLLACPARRDPLIEFLKTEEDFVAEMKAKILPQHWISPRVSPEFSHDFPIELGATRLFGEIKPWAPSFSYGLLIELDRDFLPVGSAHSRANGLRHAIGDALVWKGDLIAVSQASGEILNLGPGAQVS